MDARLRKDGTAAKPVVCGQSGVVTCRDGWSVGIAGPAVGSTVKERNETGRRTWEEMVWGAAGRSGLHGCQDQEFAVRLPFLGTRGQSV